MRSSGSNSVDIALMLDSPMNDFGFCRSIKIDTFVVPLSIGISLFNLPSTGNSRLWNCSLKRNGIFQPVIMTYVDVEI